MNEIEEFIDIMLIIDKYIIDNGIKIIEYYDYYDNNYSCQDLIDKQNKLLFNKICSIIDNTQDGCTHPKCSKGFIYEYDEMDVYSCPGCPRWKCSCVQLRSPSFIRKECINLGNNFSIEKLLNIMS